MANASSVLTLRNHEDPDQLVYSHEAPSKKLFDTTEFEPIAAESSSPGWFWPGHIRIGMMTVIEGGPGSGKTWLTFDMALRMGHGYPCPDGVPNGYGNADVLIISHHPEAECVGKAFNQEGAPKLDRFRGFTVHDVERDPKAHRLAARPISFPADLEALSDHLTLKQSIGMVIIDSLPDYCATPKALAATLLQLEEMAREREIVLIVTVPANCRTDSIGRLRVTSKWNTDAARCVWRILQDQDDTSLRYLVAKRTNFGLEPDGMAFRITNAGLRWDTQTPVRAVDPLGELSDVEEFLEEVLSEGFATSLTVIREGAEMGFPPKQLRRGAKRLGIVYQRHGFSKDGGWVWAYDDHEFAPAEDEERDEEVAERAGAADDGPVETVVDERATPPILPGQPPTQIEDDRLEFEKGWEAPAAGDDPVAAAPRAVPAVEASPADEKPVAKLPAAVPPCKVEKKRAKSRGSDAARKRREETVDEPASDEWSWDREATRDERAPVASLAGRESRLSVPSG